MKKKDVIQLVKETIKEMGSPYGHATLTTRDSGATHSRFTKTGRPPGVMEDENLKEYTNMGQEGIYPKKEEPGDMFQQKEVEELMPNAMVSRSDKAFQARLKQHAEWTEKSSYNNTFVHVQYNKGESNNSDDTYFIHQTQHYNSNYDDFRNPKFTILSITKNKGTEKEEDLGDYIVDTNAYVKDLQDLRKMGIIKGDTVSEEGDPDITAPNAASPIAVAFPPRMPRLGSYEEELHYELEEFAAFPENTTDMAPKVMAPRIKKVFDIVNGTKNPVQTPEFWKNFFKSRYGIPFPETLENITKKQAIAMNKFGNDMKQHIKEEENYIITTKTGDTDVISADPMTMNKLKSDSNIDSIKSTKGQQVKEEPSEGNAFGAAMQKAKEAGEDSFELGGKTFKVNEMKVTDKDGNDVTSDVIKRMEDRLRKAGYTITKGYSSDPDLRPGYKPFPTKDDDEEQEEYDKGWYGENLTNDIGKDDYVDDEGRFAKSQIYKMGKYSMKLHDMLDDMEQLPAWLQSKITKASDYMSMVYHYLDYEFARRDNNLMESMDKHRKRNMLMEGAMKKFFEMFDKGMTDEEVIQDYAKRGTQIPETFIGKARKQYEGLKKMKLELEMSEKEYRNSATKMVNNAEAITGMEMEEKALASGLFKENNNNKK
jgi:hypothetical protein